MFGFLIGFFCLALLISVMRGSSGCARGGRGGSRGRRGFGWSGGGHGGPRRLLGFVFDRLETTPGQEKEIGGAVEDLLDKAQDLRREGRASRNDIAKLLRTESLDETILGELFARHDDRLREAQKAFADTLGRVHLSLDPAQRERLASMLESSDGGPAWGGPYRGWV